MESTSQAEITAQLLTHQAWLRALARGLAAAGESDDLVQETWVAALEGSPEERGGLRPWIAGVVRHLASGMRRSYARRSERERSAARPEELPSTVELVTRIDTEQRLTRALLALDEPYRTTLLLRFHAGLSSAEIARRQGVPKGTVRWRLKKGLDELRARLEREYGGREALGLVLAEVVRLPGPAVGDGGSGSVAPAAKGATTMIATKGLVAGILTLSAVFTAWRIAEHRAAAPARLSGPETGTLPLVSAGAPRPSPIGGARAGAQAPSQRSQAGGDVRRIRILESDGRPNADVTVAVEAASGEPHALSGATDADGWVDFPALGGPRRMAVERVGAFPFRTELELAPGESELRLPEPEGGALAGEVLVNGSAPPKPLWLLLQAASTAAVDLDFGADWPLTLDLTSAPTDADGRFRFRGVASGLGLNLRCPEGNARKGMRAYSDPGEGAVFHLEGPDEDSRIELDRYPSVRGRVLEADGVTPAKGAYVEIEYGGNLSGRQTGPDGTFEVFDREAPEHLRIRYGWRKDWQELHGARPEGTMAEFTFHEPRDVTDLGDLLLTPSPGFFLEVHDRAGEPLAGAEAGACAEQPTNATDATGRTWMTGVAPGTVLALTMRGYRTAFVTVPDPLPGTLPVVLAPANDLTLEVRGAGGEPLAGVRVELAAPDWFLSREEPGSEAWRKNTRSCSGAGSWWRFWPPNRAFEGRRGSMWGGPPQRVQSTRTARGAAPSASSIPPPRSTSPCSTTWAPSCTRRRSRPSAPRSGAWSESAWRCRSATSAAASSARAASRSPGRAPASPARTQARGRRRPTAASASRAWQTVSTA